MAVDFGFLGEYAVPVAREEPSFSSAVELSLLTLLSTKDLL